MSIHAEKTIYYRRGVTTCEGNIPLRHWQAKFRSGFDLFIVQPHLVRINVLPNPLSVSGHLLFFSSDTAHVEALTRIAEGPLRQQAGSENGCNQDFSGPLVSRFQRLSSLR